MQHPEKSRIEKTGRKGGAAVRPRSAAGANAGASAKKSLHQQILDDLRSRILSGEWPPGTQLPFEQDIARSYGCSRMTVNKAMTQLAGAGLIERRRKAGTFVRRPQSHSVIVEIVDIGREVAALGLPHHFEIVSREIRGATAAEAERLGAAARVLSIQCRHFAARQPFCFEERLISLDSVPEAETADFEATSPGAWLVSRVPWSDVEYRIRAVAADRETAGRLLIAEGAPCLSIWRRTTSEGQPITVVCLTYPGSDHEISASFSSAEG
ncbi:UTRA domain-containing protein [Jiella avicenniae]|uniref:UTRA domain-containing protein n=1 Tax=Jiella avicenniae TaxID=2907202 RepID=A0A9X1NXL9_9HYPH|nr:UTRA domain-containing protein [Jiella avicenniae]MCE7027585.1 UTRA domain-containing protein [Jiella avicenniae]